MCTVGEELHTTGMAYLKHAAYHPLHFTFTNHTVGYLPKEVIPNAPKVKCTIERSIQKILISAQHMGLLGRLNHLEIFRYFMNPFNRSESCFLYFELIDFVVELISSLLKFLTHLQRNLVLI